MKPSEIYRSAARAMERGEGPDDVGCCYYIAKQERTADNLPGSYESKAQKEFASYFKPTESRSIWWLDSLGRDGRILALCFMAAIAEDEEREKK